jgi:hypothetical protein
MSTDGTDDSVDWGNLALPPQPVAAMSKAKVAKRSAKPFTKFPHTWKQRLADIHAHGNTYRTALHLLHRFWQTGNRRLVLANVALGQEGVNREAKRTALRQLERAGLVLVERRSRKSPIVHLLLVE